MPDLTFDLATQPTPAPEGMRPPNMFIIPAGTPASQCKKCHARIYRVPKRIVKKGKTIETIQPLRAETTCYYRAKNVIIQTPDCTPPSAPDEPGEKRDGVGFNHFIDCPFAGDFRKA